MSSGVCKRPTLYRPPYGNTNATVAALTGRMGLRGVLWNVDTVDWALAKTNPTKMLADFKSNLAATGTAGVIHLQHDLLLESVNLVPQVRGQHDGVGEGVGVGEGANAEGAHAGSASGCLPQLRVPRAPGPPVRALHTLRATRACI